MSNLKLEWMWGAAIVLVALVSTLAGASDALGFGLTMGATGIAIGHLGRRGAFSKEC